MGMEEHRQEVTERQRRRRQERTRGDRRGGNGDADKKGQERQEWMGEKIAPGETERMGKVGNGTAAGTGGTTGSPYLHVLPVEAHHGRIGHQQRLHIARLGDEAPGAAERLPGSGFGPGLRSSRGRRGGAALEAVRAAPGRAGSGRPERLQRVRRPVEQEGGAEPGTAAAEHGGSVGTPFDGPGVEAAPARSGPARRPSASQALQAEARGEERGVGSEAKHDGAAESGQAQRQLSRRSGQAGGQQRLRLSRRRRQRPGVAQQQQVERSPPAQQRPPPHPGPAGLPALGPALPPPQPPRRLRSPLYLYFLPRL